MTETVFIQVIAAFIASIGFAMLLHLRAKLLPPAALGALLTWLVYLLCGQYFEDIFIPCLIASAFAALYAQELASAYKTPLAVFFILAEIPLIPGRALYMTAASAVEKNWDAMADWAFITSEFVFAIAFGISFIWALTEIIRKVHEQRS